jgi:hypothetical protein
MQMLLQLVQYLNFLWQQVEVVGPPREGACNLKRAGGTGCRTAVLLLCNMPWRHSCFMLGHVISSCCTTCVNRMLGRGPCLGLEPALSLHGHCCCLGAALLGADQGSSCMLTCRTASPCQVYTFENVSIPGCKRRASIQPRSRLYMGPND